MVLPSVAVTFKSAFNVIVSESVALLLAADGKMGWLSHRGSIWTRVPLADVLTLPLAVYVILLPNGRLTAVD